ISSSYYYTLSSPPPPLSCLPRLQPPISTPFPYTTLFRSHLYAFISGFSRLSPRSSLPCLGDKLKRHDVFQTLYLASLRFNAPQLDRKSTRLNSSHVKNSYAVFCLNKNKLQRRQHHNCHPI